MEIKYQLKTITGNKMVTHTGSLDVDVNWNSSREFLKYVYPVLYTKIRTQPGLGENNWVGIKFFDKNDIQI